MWRGFTGTSKVRRCRLPRFVVEDSWLLEFDRSRLRFARMKNCDVAFGGVATQILLNTEDDHHHMGLAEAFVSEASETSQVR